MPGVDHVAHARHGDRRLGHVGGEDDPPAAVRPERPLLLGGRQAGVQRQDVGVGQLLVGEGGGGVADLALAAQEHEDVAGALPPQLVDRGPDAVDLVLRSSGPVAHLDRVGPPRHLDHRGVEVVGEALRVDGGRRDDQLEVGTAGEQVGEVAEQEVDVEAALVGLVDDDRVVAPQQAVALQLGQQDAVGHELDLRVLADLVGEPHRVAHPTAQLGAQLLGDAGGHRAGGQPAGLGVPDQRLRAAAELEAHLRQLGALARPGLARDHDHLVVADGGHHLVAPLGDRQLGIRDRGERGHGRSVILRTLVPSPARDSNSRITASDA